MIQLHPLQRSHFSSLSKVGQDGLKEEKCYPDLIV